jgi:hypothetical protein
VPETRAYRISGSAELFPQHCQVPNLSKNAHLKALTEELEVSTGIAAQTPKGRALIQKLGKAIKAILNPANASTQRVDNSIREEATQHDNDDLAPITRISDAPADRDFPLQLWDKLAPQVQDTLNLLRAS